MQLWLLPAGSFSLLVCHAHLQIFYFINDKSSIGLLVLNLSLHFWFGKLALPFLFLLLQLLLLLIIA